MKFVLALSLLLAACATPRPISELPKQKDDEVSENALGELKGEIRRLDYYIDHERCFTVYAICLGEAKKPKKDCWAQHEACVIRVYKQWKADK